MPTNNSAMNFQQPTTAATSNPFSQKTPLTSSPYSMNTSSSYFQPTTISEPHPQQALVFHQQPFLQPQQPQQQPMSNPWSTNSLF